MEGLLLLRWYHTTASCIKDIIQVHQMATGIYFSQGSISHSKTLPKVWQGTWLMVLDSRTVAWLGCISQCILIWYFLRQTEPVSRSFGEENDPEASTTCFDFNSSIKFLKVAAE